MRPSLERWLSLEEPNRRHTLALLAGLAFISLLARWASIFTEAVNWDEFALLARAEATLRLGHVVGHGRPGLVSLLLIPFVDDCTDSVKSVIHARIAWQAFTLSYLLGVYFLVRRWYQFARSLDRGRYEALLAVVLLAFLPAFVTWSVQVRTDQPALAAATWGGVLLLGSGPASAVFAGILFGVGMLCTQKAAYVIALCGLLYATGGWARFCTVSSRDFLYQGVRLMLAAAAGAAVVGGFLWLSPSGASLVSGEAVASAADTMQSYRLQLGYRAYTVNAHRLLLHWFLLVVLVLVSLGVLLRRVKEPAHVLVTAWLVLWLGAVVVWFHASSFPYFLMTAGLFPAVALGLSTSATLGDLSDVRWKFALGLALLAMLRTAPESYEMLRGSLHRQEATMAFIGQPALQRMRGYQVEGALFCSGELDPLPALFTRGIVSKFRNNPQAVNEFIAEFRHRPIGYIVDSYRLRQFPRPIREFWGEHYVPYSNSVYVTGFVLSPKSTSIDVLVPGKYRWVAMQKRVKGPLRVGGVTVPRGGTVQLTPGRHEVASPESGALLPADVSGPRDLLAPFYDPRQQAQLSGYQ